MNIIESDVLNVLSKESFTNQRLIADITGYSLGAINGALRSLASEGYINDNAQLTLKAHELMKRNKPKNAIILAAGVGMRMVPINMTSPKALLEIEGEKLIERLIRQLKEVGISDITVVVGFMKDTFEYLIDDYGVELVVNNDYATRNNLHSLALIADKIHNTYIVPCDIWCASNPFSSNEIYSWYMVSDQICQRSFVRINRKKDLVLTKENECGNKMIGIGYLTEPESSFVKKKLAEMDDDRHAEAFWEDTLYDRDRLVTKARLVSAEVVVEINTYEQLREIAPGSSQLKSDAISIIASTLDCKQSDVREISVLKKGMTNRSFLFSVNDKKYIMRIPGEGTEKLVNRKLEEEVYHAISGYGLCDDPLYINSDNGYKITKYLHNVRPCDPNNVEDLKLCMEKLRNMHRLKLSVSNSFDIFGQIQFYESLWEGEPSIFKDYTQTKSNVFSLKPFIAGIEKECCLTHIDAVPDNFLFYMDDNGVEKLQLTDWEYSGMQDPHVDVAMFCIYSLYDKKQCDRLIDIYFDGECEKMTRAKIYSYIAICGLLWSNWCEFKRRMGVEFGEYSLRQYRYAKDFYRYTKELLGELE